MKHLNWVLDASKKERPKKYRVLTLGGRQIIACGAFSEKQLEAFPIKRPCALVDLRKEVHFYIGGEPVSLYGEKNWHAKGWTSQKILEFEKNSPLPKSLGWIGSKDQESRIVKLKEAPYPEGQKESERAFAKRQGLAYRRFFIPDHCPPSSSQLKRIHAFFEKLPAKMNLLVHCRGGSGRTTTFVVLYHIFCEGMEKSLDEILAYHHEIGGKNLASLPSKDHYKYQPAFERLELIKKYYNFIS